MLPFANAFKAQKGKTQIGEAHFDIYSRIRVPMTYKEAAEMLSPSYYRNQLSKRGKDAYVDTLEGVEHLILQLKLQHMDGKAIIVSKKPFAHLYERWTFAFMPWSASVTYGRLKSLFQSGIVTLWRLWKFRLDTWNDTVATARQEMSEFKPLSTSDSNLMAVFYLHAMILGLSAVVFTAETRLKLFRQLIGKKSRKIASQPFHVTKIQVTPPSCHTE